LLQIEAPVGYHAAFDRRTFASILLLEDLVATKSATFCNHRTYVTREMADDMIDVLAALHARFYGGSRACDAISLGGRLSEMVHDRCRKDEPGALHPEGIRSRFARHSRSGDGANATSVAAACVHLPSTKARAGLIHSDVHIGKLYRTAAGKMGLCDWQCLSRGHWSRDFAYAVTAALTPADRRMWEKICWLATSNDLPNSQARGLISTRAFDITGSRWCTRS